MISPRGYVYLSSLLVHGGIAVAVVEIRTPPVSNLVAITLTSFTPPPPPAPPPPPPLTPEPPHPDPAPLAPPKAAPRPRAAKVAAPPPRIAPTAPTPTPAPEFGVELGAASGPGGIAVPIGDPNAAPHPRAVERTLESKVLSEPRPTLADDCPDPPAKPKPLQVSQPAYPEEARAAGIQGKVRVELTVDATGAVVRARIVEGLGHGLDEAAVEAVRGYKFEPAVRCGKAVSATFTIAIRFVI